MPLPAINNPPLSVALTKAANDWTLDRWIGGDKRLYAAILVPTQEPEEGAAEIRRMARNPRVVAAMIAANGLGKPFGHAAYYPLYAACVETDLPVIVHAGGDATADVLTLPTAGGVPATYTDLYVLSHQSLMTHFVSLIGQGVFERFPTLKVMFVGAGFGWLAPLLWRFETNYRPFHRDAPWLTKTPTEYLVDHIRIGTQPLDRGPSPEVTHRYLMAEPALAGVLCYASGYPRWNRDAVDDVKRWLPLAWAAGALWDNASTWFRWPANVRNSAPAAGQLASEKDGK
jgi:predicted TIM-barrel fold metal-dependent hydrolase